MFRCCALLVAALAAVAVAAPVEKDGTLIPGFGKIIDPNNDCRFTVEDGRLTIAIPGSDHGLSVEQNRMGPPRVLQDVDGDFVVQVEVGGAFPQGATSLIEGRRAFHGTGLLLWQDEGTYLRLEGAELVLDGMNITMATLSCARTRSSCSPATQVRCRWRARTCSCGWSGAVPRSTEP